MHCLCQCHVTKEQMYMATTRQAAKWCELVDLFFFTRTQSCSPFRRITICYIFCVCFGNCFLLSSWTLKSSSTTIVREHHCIVLTNQSPCLMFFFGGASTVPCSCCCGWWILGRLLECFGVLRGVCNMFVLNRVALSLTPTLRGELSGMVRPARSLLSGSLGYASCFTTPRWQPMEAEPNLAPF